ncbi:hypothetical protein PENSPDRAFT_692241 [Peniophora sp. CONT]|nr:hypothetical protein PENSPDRAFT_692241 [Peniophora sp. CONT]
MANPPNNRAPAARITELAERLTAMAEENARIEAENRARAEAECRERAAARIESAASAAQSTPPVQHELPRPMMRFSGRNPNRPRPSQPASSQSGRPPKHSAGSYPPPPRVSQPQSSRPPLPRPIHLPHSSQPSRPPALNAPPPSSPPALNAPPPSSPTPPSPLPPATPTLRKILDGYEKAVRSANGATFSYGTSYVPPDLSGRRMAGYIYKDARWGPFDYTLYPHLFDHRGPHMGFIELPKDIWCQTDWVWYRAPTNGDLEDDIRVHEDLKQIFKDGIIRPGADFVCRKKVHDEVRDRVNALRVDFDIAARHLSGALRAGALPAPIAKLVSGMVVPRVAAAEMRRAWGMLRWGKLRTFADFAVCWNACQRFASEIDAFIRMCAKLLEDHVRHRELEEWLQHRRADGFAYACPLRGVILTSTDFDAYHGIFRKLGVPTYLRVSPQEADLEGIVFESADLKPRCDLDVNARLSFPVQKDLPELWYPPEHAEWELVEVLARSNVPRNTVFQASELIQAEQKKKENMEREAKRQRQQYADNLKVRADKFGHQNVTANSIYRYDFHKRFNPALQRFFEMQDRPRPVYISSRIIPYAAAEAVMYNDNLFVVADANGKKGTFTFLPPLHLFTGDVSKNDLRLAKYMAAFVFLLPMLLRLVELSRLPGASVRRFGTADWRTLLQAEWEEETFWENSVAGETLPGSEVKGTRGDKSRKHGKGVQRGNGSLVFGAETFAYLQTHPEERPPFGRLPCGHQATIADIQGDHTLYAGLLFSLNQWLLLHGIPNLLSDRALDASTIPAVTDIHGSHNTPDFMRLDRNPKKTSMPAIVRRIVLGGSSGNQSISEHGWPALWSPDEADEKGRRKWLTDMKEVLSRVKNAEDVDRMKPKGPSWEWDRNDLHKITVGNLPGWKMEVFEQHIYLRYVLTYLKLGKTPVEFQDVPKGDAHSCRSCRANAPSYQEMMEGLSDED